MRVADILNLPGWQVCDLEEQEDRYLIRATCRVEREACSACGNPTPSKHGVDSQAIHDLPCHGKQVVIAIDKQRYSCQRCHKTWFAVLPEIDEQHSATLRLVRYVQRQSLTRTFVQIARDTGISERSVRRIFDDHVTVLEQDRQIHLPRVLGLDEVHLMSQPRAVITDLETRRIVEILADRRRASIARWLARFPDQEVLFAVIDMHLPYLEVLLERFPRVCITIDKWHVVKQINEIVETVRKEVRASLSDSQRRMLMRDRYLLLRRGESLTEQEVLIRDVWPKQFPRLEAVYWRKEEFCHIYDARTEEQAWECYIAWHDRVAESGVYDAFLSFFLTMETWGSFVFNYFQERYTGSFVEGANSLIRSQDRAGRGYSFAVLRARMLYGEPVCHSRTRPPKAEVAVGESVCVDARLLLDVRSTQNAISRSP